MSTFQFRCPNTDLDVQAFIAEEIGSETYVVEVEQCVACDKSHIVHLKAEQVVQTAE